MTSWLVFAYLCLYDMPCLPNDKNNMPIGYQGSMKFDSELECEQARVAFMQMQKRMLEIRGKDDLWIGECQEVKLDVR